MNLQHPHETPHSQTPSGLPQSNSPTVKASLAGSDALLWTPHHSATAIEASKLLISSPTILEVFLLPNQFSLSKEPIPSTEARKIQAGVYVGLDFHTSLALAQSLIACSTSSSSMRHLPHILLVPKCRLHLSKLVMIRPYVINHTKTFSRCWIPIFQILRQPSHLSSPFQSLDNLYIALTENWLLPSPQTNLSLSSLSGFKPIDASLIKHVEDKCCANTPTSILFLDPNNESLFDPFGPCSCHSAPPRSKAVPQPNIPPKIYAPTILNLPPQTLSKSAPPNMPFQICDDVYPIELNVIFIFDSILRTQHTTPYSSRMR